MKPHTMNNRRRIVTLAMLVITTILSACGRPAAGVPDTLHTMEEGAEDIIDLAPSGGWDKITGDVTAIAAAWKSYQPQAGRDGANQATQDALASALTRLQTATGAKDAATTMQAANDLSAAVIELFALYKPVVPADIGRLDVLERQVILDVAANNFTAAAASLAKTKAVWASVKPSVEAHDGKDVEAQFETSLASQEAALQAKDGSALTAEARNGLEIVDALEKLY